MSNVQPPNGAGELSLCLSSYYHFGGRWVLGLPALVWGEPGEGKTSFVYWVSRGRPVCVLVGSTHDPTDFSGLPVADRDNETGHRRVVFAEPHFVREVSNDGVLFLDELTTSPPLVQGVMLRLVLERSCGSYRLPDRVRVVSAANPPSSGSSVSFALHHALANRFIHIEWEMPVRTYTTALREGWDAVYNGTQLVEPDLERFVFEKKRAQLIVSAYLDSHPTSFRGKPGDGKGVLSYAFPSPRTWDFVSSLVAGARLGGFPDKVLSNCVCGCVGPEEALKFWKYWKSLKLLGGGDVVSGRWSKQDLENMRDDELQIVCSDAVAYWLSHPSKEGLNNVLEFALAVCEKGVLDGAYPGVRVLVRSGLAPQHCDNRGKELFRKVGFYMKEAVQVLK